MKCELCQREDQELTFHHLIPVCLHKNKWFKKNFTKEQMNQGIMICQRYCHREIHSLIAEKEMGRYYNTIKLLLEHKEIRKYIRWIKKRSTE